MLFIQMLQKETKFKPLLLACPRPKNTFSSYAQSKELKLPLKFLLKPERFVKQSLALTLLQMLGNIRIISFANLILMHVLVHHHHLHQCFISQDLAGTVIEFVFNFLHHFTRNFSKISTF